MGLPRRGTGGALSVIYEQFPVRRITKGAGTKPPWSCPYGNWFRPPEAAPGFVNPLAVAAHPHLTCVFLRPACRLSPFPTSSPLLFHFYLYKDLYSSTSPRQFSHHHQSTHTRPQQEHLLGIATATPDHIHQPPHFLPSSILKSPYMACHQMGARRPTVRDLSSMMSTPQQPRPTPAATWFLDDDGADAAASSGHHFLDECRMCGRYLPKNRDIYMYKGDTPFCSEDCRDEQIRIDELQERANRRRRAAKVAAAEASSRSSSARVESRTAAVAVGVV